MSAVSLAAHQLRPGLTVLLNNAEWVTLAEVQDQGPWVTNSTVYLTGENGQRYGLGRYDCVPVQVR